MGAIGADLVRYLTSAVIMLAFGAALGFRLAPGAGPLAVLAALMVIMGLAFALCWVFTALAMLVRDPRSVQGIGMLVLFPVTFGSTVFVPAETMPDWLRAWAEVNPVSHAAAAERALLVGGPAAGSVAVVLAWSLGVLAVFAPLAVGLYRRRA